ncbi:somatomedin-B and thrombospondin type-1 domain-containing protein-like isoform X4 [Emydura macquarii macquarii]|uniref:somatomedin-B and thrombospondin type-1 domain-containing protein-like isoform X4 n=1 Tax=Emydura macquarii macquarii TaxID=1129001 RepID=UPI00352A40A6
MGDGKCFMSTFTALLISLRHSLFLPLCSSFTHFFVPPLFICHSLLFKFLFLILVCSVPISYLTFSFPPSDSFPHCLSLPELILHPFPPPPHLLSHFLAAIHCMVGPWGPWSECSSLCGVGSKDRTRQVTVPPRNGGTPCPDLKQRRGCFGENQICDTAKEVAKILPDSFKRDFKDPWRRPHMLAKEKQPSYCVYFRLKQVGAACRLHFWSSQLMRERRVCVECQREAVGSRGRCEGDGLEGAREKLENVTPKSVQKPEGK